MSSLRVLPGQIIFKKTTWSGCGLAYQSFRRSRSRRGLREGCVFSNRSSQTLLDKLLLLLAEVSSACGKTIRSLLAQNSHLISRFNKNVCAYAVPVPPKHASRDRPERSSELL